ncbi:hypothetical protein, variant [Spizellomyces punctatus DAOM BR117]|nr:hypothetical protein, variant [Spizellomyces punctatus DAOM BR117]KNC97028.1 hypothetical protein, variant [Spizellomyces punctatus DAOM BR117]|eukprot:XP_016605068.1 hypothetical protein, variant [Spizellomyces punctatus DAOM BR117]
MLIDPCIATLRSRSPHILSIWVFRGILLFGAALASAETIAGMNVTMSLVVVAAIFFRSVSGARIPKAHRNDDFGTSYGHLAFLLTIGTMLIVGYTREHFAQTEHANTNWSIPSLIVLTSVLAVAGNYYARVLDHIVSGTILQVVRTGTAVIVLLSASTMEQDGWPTYFHISTQSPVTIGIFLVMAGAVGGIYCQTKEEPIEIVGTGKGYSQVDAYKGQLSTCAVARKSKWGTRAACCWQVIAWCFLLSSVIKRSKLEGPGCKFDGQKTGWECRSLYDASIKTQNNLPDEEKAVTFKVSPNARPRRLTEPTFYERTPLHPARPRNQFLSSGSLAGSTPILSILTVTKNPKPIFESDTAAFVLQQSLQSFRWIIVNDHTDIPEAMAMLTRVAASDPRIVLVNNTGNPGISNARNVARQHSNAKYEVCLDDDDLRELVSLEQAVWLLETNPHLAIVCWYMVSFGSYQDTTLSGPHTGSRQLSGNRLFSGSLYRRSASVNCSYDPALNSGGDDYDYWLCLAANGNWGATIPELSYWYRVGSGHTWTNLLSNWDKTFAYIRSKYPSLTSETWPAHDIPPSQPSETVRWGRPFDNWIASMSENSALVLIDSFGGNVSGRRTLQMVGDLARLGWRVTVAAVLHDSEEIRPEYYMYTHDVFSLPLFLRTADFPRFLTYLAESRGIKAFVLTESVFGYEALPSLVEHLPDNTMVYDYIHSIDAGPLSRGFAAMSAASGKYIYRTFVANAHVRDFIVKRGRNPESVYILDRGIDTGYLKPPRDITRARMRTFQSASISVAGACVVAYTSSSTNAPVVVEVASALASLLGRRKLLMVPLHGSDLQEAVRDAIRSRDDVASAFHEEPYISDERYRLLIAVSSTVLSFSSSIDNALVALALGVPIVSADDVQEVKAAFSSVETTAATVVDSIQNVSALAMALLANCNRKWVVNEETKKAAKRKLENTTASSILAAHLNHHVSSPKSTIGADAAVYSAIEHLLRDHRLQADAYEHQIRLPDYLKH